MSDINHIAELLTEDPDIFNEGVLNEFILKQYEEFWNALAEDPQLAKFAQTKDVQALVDAFGAKVSSLADYAEKQGWTTVARDLRRKSGLEQETEHWTGPNRPGVWGGDY